MRSGFFVGTHTKLPGKPPKNTPMSVYAEIRLKDIADAYDQIAFAPDMSMCQWQAVNHVVWHKYVSTATRDFLTVTLKSLVKRGVLVPVISDEEIEIQKALGIIDKPRYYKLNDQLIQAIVYDLRTQDWLVYTSKGE